MSGNTPQTTYSPLHDTNQNQNNNSGSTSPAIGQFNNTSFQPQQQTPQQYGNINLGRSTSSTNLSLNNSNNKEQSQTLGVSSTFKPSFSGPTLDSSSFNSASSLQQPGGSSGNLAFGYQPQQPPTYFPNPLNSSSAQLTGDDNTLKRLIKIGNWNNVFKVSDLCIASTNNPQSILQYKLCRIIAHVKMRSYGIADGEIKGIGDIRDLINCYESYPHLFPGKKGTMVPFSMRIIKAELACHLNTEKFQLDSLYGLLSICKKEINNINEIIKNKNLNINNNNINDDISKNQNIYLSQLENTTSSLISPRPETIQVQSPINSNQDSNNTNNNSNNSNINNNNVSTPLPISNFSVEEIFENSSSPTTLFEQLSLWKQRERRITFSIVTFILQKNRDFLLAIKILEDLIQKQQADPYILSALGRIHLQMGNIKDAEKIFNLINQLYNIDFNQTSNNNNNNNNNGLLILSYMNFGFLAVSTDQYQLAIDYFEKITQIDPSNIQAINNKCISMLYTCDLGGSITELEKVLANEREKSIDETLIFNICSLYELASDKSNEKKKSIMGDIAKKAPDNFDFKVFKISANPTI